MKRYLIAGLLVWVPLGITIWVLYFLVSTLDQTLLSGAGSLRVIHGHGTGRLRQGLRAHFRTHGSVETLRAADAREGGNGATILELR